MKNKKIICTSFFFTIFLLVFQFFGFYARNVFAASECGSCDSSSECGSGMTCADCKSQEVLKNCPGSGCSDAAGRCVSASSSGSSSYSGSGAYSYRSYGSSGYGWNPYFLAYFGLPGGSVTGIIIGILKWILYLFGFLGIIGFAISGIMYLLSAGDDDAMKRAKRAMQYSIIGVIVGLIGVIVLKTAYAVLSQGLYYF